MYLIRMNRNLGSTVDSMASAATAICTPTIATAAIFLAILALDLVRMEFGLMGGHLILGLISTLLISVVCQNANTFVAWMLLLTPFALLLLSWIALGVKRKIDERQGPYRTDPTAMPAAAPACCNKPRPAPCCLDPAKMAQA
jgi:hypothetical protein